MKRFAISALLFLIIAVTTAPAFANNSGQTGTGGVTNPPGTVSGGGTAPSASPDSTGTAPGGTTTPAPVSTDTTTSGTTSGATTTTPPVIRAPEIIAPSSLGTRNASRYSYREIANTLLPSVATWLASALGALAVLFLIWAGIQFLTAEGDPEKIGAATKTALYVIAGVVLIMFAYAMVYLFLSIFTPG